MAGGASYNGWPASDDRAAIGVVNFGDAVGLPFPGGVKGGDVATVLAYLCVQLHYRVEPCVAGWDWGYEYRANVNSPSQLSCHASGTAVDWNAPLHPNGTSTGPGGGGGWTAEQYAEVCRILDELDGAVDWLTSNDPMHFEIDVSAATLADVAARLPPLDTYAPGGGGSTPDDRDDRLRKDDPVIFLQTTEAEGGRLYLLVPGRPKAWLDGPTWQLFARLYPEWAELPGSPFLEAEVDTVNALIQPS